MTNETLPEVWVTKYALTSGVIGCHNDAVFEVDGEKVVTLMGIFYAPEWHTTEAAAKAHAEQMRLKKIASLRKQIEKLEKLTF